MSTEDISSPGRKVGCPPVRRDWTIILVVSLLLFSLFFENIIVVNILTVTMLCRKVSLCSSLKHIIVVLGWFVWVPCKYFKPLTWRTHEETTSWGCAQFMVSLKRWKPQRHGHSAYPSREYCWEWPLGLAQTNTLFLLGQSRPNRQNRHRSNPMQSMKFIGQQIDRTVWW